VIRAESVDSESRAVYQDLRGRREMKIRRVLQTIRAGSRSRIRLIPRLSAGDESFERDPDAAMEPWRGCDRLDEWFAEVSG
jgi:hypothetical protein